MGNFAHNVGGKPLGKVARRVLAWKFNLHHDQWKIKELINFPNQSRLTDTMTHFANALALRQRPKPFKCRAIKRLLGFLAHNALSLFDGVEKFHGSVGKLNRSNASFAKSLIVDGMLRQIALLNFPNHCTHWQRGHCARNPNSFYFLHGSHHLDLYVTWGLY